MSQSDPASDNVYCGLPFGHMSDSDTGLRDELNEQHRAAVEAVVRVARALCDRERVAYAHATLCGLEVCAFSEHGDGGAYLSIQLREVWFNDYDGDGKHRARRFASADEIRAAGLWPEVGAE